MSTLETLARNLNVPLEALNARVAEVLNGPDGDAWRAAGKDEETCKSLAARIAARQLKMEGDRIAKSGCTLFEGMFIRAPSYKDWADMAYKKNERVILESGGNGTPTVDAMIKNNTIAYFESNGEVWLKHTGDGTSEVDELPRIHRELANGDAFYLVWDNSNPTFPSGDANFKYMAPRPLNEYERTSFFFGRKIGETNLRLIKVRANGEEAKKQFTTFVPGTIALRAANNPDTAYVKKGVSNFTPDESRASIFPGPPIEVIGGLLAESGGLLENFGAIETYHTEHREDADWWSQWIATVGEVVHIDPRERGGFVVTLGDLDVTSIAPTIDIYVPGTQEHLVDFGLGSQVMIVGSCYKTRNDEMRFSVDGWWCMEKIASVSADDDWEE